jgi:hypothetical protein
MVRLASQVFTSISPRHILEPGCGPDAPFLQAASRVWPVASLYGIEWLPGHDVNGSNFSLRFGQDFMAWEPLGGTKFDLIITNPPFSLALEFLERSRELLTTSGVILFLLPLTWLASRRRWVRLFNGMHRPFKVWVLAKRPSFTGDRKTNATEYGIFAWNKVNSYTTLLSWIAPPNEK